MLSDPDPMTMAAHLLDTMGYLSFNANVPILIG